MDDIASSAPASARLTCRPFYCRKRLDVSSVHKVSGDWPMVGDKTTEVTVGDDNGATLVVRFQRPTISPELADELQTIGDGWLALTGIVVQDDPDISDGLLSDFAVWPRGDEDITAAP